MLIYLSLSSVLSLAWFIYLLHHGSALAATLQCRFCHCVSNSYSPVLCTGRWLFELPPLAWALQAKCALNAACTSCECLAPNSCQGNLCKVRHAAHPAHSCLVTVLKFLCVCVWVVVGGNSLKCRGSCEGEGEGDVCSWHACAPQQTTPVAMATLLTPPPPPSLLQLPQCDVANKTQVCGALEGQCACPSTRPECDNGVCKVGPQWVGRWIFM